MLERPVVRAGHQQPDARVVLADYVQHYVGAASRVAAIHHVIESAAGLDDDLRALSAEGWAQRRFGMGKLAERLDALGSLRDDLTVETAGDLLWNYNDPQTYYKLVIQRGWPVEQFVEWLRRTLTEQLIRPGYRPKK